MAVAVHQQKPKRALSHDPAGEDSGTTSSKRVKVESDSSGAHRPCSVAASAEYRWATAFRVDSSGDTTSLALPEQTVERIEASSVSERAVESCDAVTRPAPPSPWGSTYIVPRTLLIRRRCAAKGTRLLEMLSRGSAPPSAYTFFSQLADSGWIARAGNDNDDDDEADGDPDIESLADVASAIDWDVGASKKYDYRRPQPWIQDRHQPSGFYTARHSLWVSPSAGVIAVTAAFAPRDARDKTTGQMIRTPLPLRYWSDVAFLCWQDACGGSVSCLKGLRWVIVVDVANANSRIVTREVLGIVEGGRMSLEKWPGESFAVSEGHDEKGRALLGTPNGAGTAWLLVEHEARLGRRTVDEVRVFGNDDDALCFAFRVVEK